MQPQLNGGRPLPLLCVAPGAIALAILCILCVAGPAAALYETELVEGYLVTAPNGNPLWTRIIQPRADLYPDQSFPALVSVGGGLSAGENGNRHVARNGFVELHFNAEGRGVLHPSPGTEDHNGFVHQDDLEAVIQFAHTLDNVLDDNLGVITSSYGITMGAGCLGRYPELEVKYLIDIEGPSESYVTCFEPWALDGDPSNDRHQQAYLIFGHWSIARDPSPENVAWWSEREATRTIGDLRCRYLRVQAEWDHAQPPNAQWPGFDYPPLWYPCKHAIDLVNLATGGGVPWTGVNHSELGNPPNSTYSRESPPVYYSGRFANHFGETERLIGEMAAMPPLGTAAAGAPPAAPPGSGLRAAYPNPFNPRVTIRFELAGRERVRLGVHDASGRRVAQLLDGTLPAGAHQVVWSGLDDGGRRMASGVYFIRFATPAARDARRLTLLR